MDEINPILFYSFIYRLGELFVKQQIKGTHSLHFKDGHDISYDLALLNLFIMEGYKTFLLFGISKEKKGKPYRNFNITIAAVITTFAASFSIYLEKEDKGISLLEFFSIFVSQCLSILITCVSVVFIRNLRGRMAGFIELINLLLEVFLFLLLMKFNPILSKILSSSITLLVYYILDKKSIRQVLSDSGNDVKEFFFFIFLGIFKFLEYPEIIGRSKAFFNPFLLDDVMHDVFITVFLFCSLFMKGEVKDNSLKKLVNTIAIVFSFSQVALYLSLGESVEEYYYKILLTNSQIMVIRTLIELSYIKNQGKDEGIVFYIKFMVGISFLLLKFIIPNFILIFSPIVNISLSIFYLFICNERTLKDLPLPNWLSSMTFIFMFLVPFL